MPRTIDDILAHPHVKVEERLDEMGHYTIRLGSLQTEITIELGRFWHGERTKFRQSHVIHTPLQPTPYRTSRAFSETWEYALEDVLRTPVSDYEAAVSAGHQPQETWLVRY